MKERLDIRIKKDILSLALADEYKRCTLNGTDHIVKYAVSILIPYDRDFGAFVIYDNHGKISAHTVLSLEYTSKIYRVARVVRDTYQGKLSQGIVIALPMSQLHRYEMSSFDLVEKIFADLGFTERQYIAVDGAYYERISLASDNLGDYK